MIFSRSNVNGCSLRCDSMQKGSEVTERVGIICEIVQGE